MEVEAYTKANLDKEVRREEILFGTGNNKFQTFKKLPSRTEHRSKLNL